MGLKTQTSPEKMSLCFFQETNRREKREKGKHHGAGNRSKDRKGIETQHMNIEQPNDFKSKCFTNYQSAANPINMTIFLTVPFYPYNNLTNSGFIHCRFILYMYIHKNMLLFTIQQHVCLCVCVLRVNDVCSTARLSLIQQQMLAYYPGCVFDKNKALWLCPCVSSVWAVINTVKLYVRVLLSLNRSSR